MEIIEMLRLVEYMGKRVEDGNVKDELRVLYGVLLEELRKGSEKEGPF